MKLVELSVLFEVEYGNKFDLNKMDVDRSPESIAFVGRSRENNGVTSTVKAVAGEPPYDAGLITVALGGSYLLNSHVQMRPFYTAQNVAVLTPRTKMSLNVKLYYCQCLEANRFKYSAFGREANRTLRKLLVPTLESIPKWVEGLKEPDFENLIDQMMPSSFEVETDKLVPVSALFEIKYGTNYELNRMQQSPRGVAFVSRTSRNNGISARVVRTEEPPTPPGCLTVALGGSVLETFLQDEPTYQGRDINVLIPKEPMSVGEKLWYCAAIRQHQFRFSFGRQANKALPTLLIPKAPSAFKNITIGDPKPRFQARVKGTASF